MLENVGIGNEGIYSLSCSTTLSIETHRQCAMISQDNIQINKMQIFYFFFPLQAGTQLIPDREI